MIKEFNTSGITLGGGEAPKNSSSNGVGKTLIVLTLVAVTCYFGWKYVIKPRIEAKKIKENEQN